MSSSPELINMNRGDSTPAMDAIPTDVLRTKTSASAELLTPWQQVITQAEKNVETDGTIILLGNYNSGKSTLLRELQSFAAGDIDYSESLYNDTGGAFLSDCAVIPARLLNERTAEYSNHAATVFIMQDRKYAELSLSLTAEHLIEHGLKYATILITTSLTDFSRAYIEVKNWLEFAAAHIHKLLDSAKAVNPQKAGALLDSLKELREERIERRRQQRQLDSEKGQSQSDDEPTTTFEEEDFVNLGMHVIVCGCKSDCLPSSAGSTILDDRVRDENVFFIHLRELCRCYGADLIVWNKEMGSHPNMERLYAMLTSKILGEENPFKQACLSPNECLYLPNGVDSHASLRALAETFGTSLDNPVQTELRTTAPNRVGEEQPLANLATSLVDEKSAKFITFNTFLSNLAVHAPDIIVLEDAKSPSTALLGDSAKVGESPSGAGGIPAPSGSFTKETRRPSRTRFSSKDDSNNEQPKLESNAGTEEKPKRTPTLRASIAKDIKDRAHRDSIKPQ